MKLQSIRAAAMLAVLFVSPLVTFAAGQPRLHPSDTRSGAVSRANTLHLRKAVETLKRENQSSPKRSDSAFRK